VRALRAEVKNCSEHILGPRAHYLGFWAMDSAARPARPVSAVLLDGRMRGRAAAHIGASSGRQRQASCAPNPASRPPGSSTPDADTPLLEEGPSCRLHLAPLRKQSIRELETLAVSAGAARAAERVERDARERELAAARHERRREEARNARTRRSVCLACLRFRLTPLTESAPLPGRLSCMWTHTTRCTSGQALRRFVRHSPSGPVSYCPPALASQPA